MQPANLTLAQKLLIAALAGALVGLVGALASHHLTRYVTTRSVRRTPLPPPR